MKDKLNTKVDLFETLQKLSIDDDDIEIYIDEDGEIEIEMLADTFIEVIKNMWDIDD